MAKKKDVSCVFCAGFGNVKGNECWGCKGSGKQKDANKNLGKKSKRIA
jgi:hypothetical protein